MSFDSILTLGQTALELGLISSLTVLALFLSYSMPRRYGDRHGLRLRHGAFADENGH